LITGSSSSTRRTLTGSFSVSANAFSIPNPSFTV
jgi:hypothetical protein